METWFYYLHSESKDLIAKRFRPEDDSPFVVRSWSLNTGNRMDAWRIALEGLALGANLDRIKELASKWNLTKHDAFRMMTRIDYDKNPPSELMRDGLKLFIKNILGIDEATFVAEFATWAVEEERRNHEKANRQDT